jgi:hypothetical protein
LTSSGYFVIIYEKLRRVFMEKRIIIATIFGFLCGVVCMAFNGAVPLAVKMQILASRTLIGFAIGISGLKMKWWLHGLLIGLIFSVPLGFSSVFASALSPYLLFSITVLLGMVYGLIIELFTTVIFKANA